MRLRAALGAGAIALAAALVACSSASTALVPAVAGKYSAWVIDGANGCMVAGLTEGASGSGVPLTVLQDAITPQNVTVTLGGAPGALLQELSGTASMSGTLSTVEGIGSQALLSPSLTDGGAPMPTTIGKCTYSVIATLQVTFASDTVQGTLLYAFSTNGDPSCGKLSSCQTVQALAAVLVPGDI